MPGATRRFEVRQTEDFAKWVGALKDLSAADRVAARVRRLELGNPGRVEPVGEGVSELKLCGGDKRTQDKDIKRAKAMAKEV